MQELGVIRQCPCWRRRDEWIVLLGFRPHREGGRSTVLLTTGHRARSVRQRLWSSHTVDASVAEPFGPLPTYRCGCSSASERRPTTGRLLRGSATRSQAVTWGQQQVKEGLDVAHRQPTPKAYSLAVMLTCRCSLRSGLRTTHRPHSARCLLPHGSCSHATTPCCGRPSSHLDGILQGRTLCMQTAQFMRCVDPLPTDATLVTRQGCVWCRDDRSRSGHM